jgi:PAS domain S-box-containing protein
MEKLVWPAGSNLAEKFLEHHSDFHKLLLDDLYDAVYFVDTDRRILYWNHAAEAVSGFAASEVMGRRCSQHSLPCR